MMKLEVKSPEILVLDPPSVWIERKCAIVENGEHFEHRPDRRQRPGMDRCPHRFAGRRKGTLKSNDGTRKKARGAALPRRPRLCTGVSGSFDIFDPLDHRYNTDPFCFLLIFFFLN